MLMAEAGGMRWIYIGTGVSSAVLLALLVYILVTLESVASPATHPQLTITVTAYDWWWKIDYADDPNPARNFATANEIHIPVGEPVKVLLKSADVVHAFWVPPTRREDPDYPRTDQRTVDSGRPSRRLSRTVLAVLRRAARAHGIRSRRPKRGGL